LERVRERLLRKGIVDTDPENLDVQLLELAVVGLPGREVLRSHRGEILTIELDKDKLLPLKLAQTDFLSYRTGEREIWRLLPDLQCQGHASSTQYANDQHPK
jgi:hypothetical protein